MKKISKLPTIKIEIKDASKLKSGLVDINGHSLPREGIIIKKVTHNSQPVTEYIVPEGNNYDNYLSRKLDEVDMGDFLKKAREKL